MSTMATATSVDTDAWISLPATWELYLGLLEARGERNRPKYTFVDGRLTVVSPGMNHELVKTRLRVMIEDLLEILGIDVLPCGEVTLRKSSRSQAGTEADETYYVTNLERVHGKENLVMGEDPPPDLAIEVVFWHGEHDALEAHRRIGVREVWVCKHGEPAFLVLGEDHQYAESPRSSLLPFLESDELAEWLYRPNIVSGTKFKRLFRAWATETLVPRYRPGGEG